MVLAQKIFGAADAGLEKVEKGHGGKSRFEIEYDSDEERKAAFKRKRKARQAAGIVHDSDGDSTESDDDETKLRKERERDEAEEAAFHPKIKPLDYSGQDSRVNASMANRVSRRLLGDGRLTQSMRNPTINLDDVATATIRLSPLSKSHRRLSGLDGGSPGSTGGDGGSFTLSSSLNMTRTVGADFSSDSSPKKDHIGTSAPGIDTPYLGQTMDELAVSTKVRVSSKKSRTNTVDFKAPRGMQKYWSMP